MTWDVNKLNLVVRFKHDFSCTRAGADLQPSSGLRTSLCLGDEELMVLDPYVDVVHSGGARDIYCVLKRQLNDHLRTFE